MTMCGEQSNNLAALLRATKVFGALDDDEITAVVEVGHTRTFPNKALIFKKDAESNALFVILSGKVRIMNQLENDPSAIIATIGPGDLFGETSILQREPRSTFAVAFEETELFVLMRENIEALLAPENPLSVKILQGFCDLLSSRLRQTTKPASKVFHHMGEKFKSYHEAMDRINLYFASNMFYFR